MQGGDFMQDITLKQARLLREKTQQEVADMMGIHVQTYRKIEECREEATIAQARKIADFLGFKYDEIFFDNNSTVSR